MCRNMAEIKRRRSRGWNWKQNKWLPWQQTTWLVEKTERALQDLASGGQVVAVSSVVLAMFSASRGRCAETGERANLFSLILFHRSQKPQLRRV